MSDKFGVELILGSGLTTLVHLARQATCAQFGAEDTLRLPLRVTLVPFFDMPERGLKRLEDDIAEVISGLPDKALSFWISGSDMVVNSATGSVLMKLGLHGESVFSVLEKSPPKQKKRSLFGFGRSREDDADAEPPVHPMMALQREIWEVVSHAPGSRIFNRDYEFLPHLPIIHRSGLSKSDLADAAEYAARSISNLEATNVTSPWRIWLVRYSSESVGDDWRDGKWLSDVTWRIERSFRLTTD